LTLIAVVLLFALSALFDPLRWIQPALFLVMSPLAIVPTPKEIYGLGFFIMGVLLLERAGFFLRRRPIKVTILIIYLFATEIVAVYVTKRPLQDGVSPAFFIIAFGIFLWFLYKDRLVVFLKEPKPRLSLSEKGLTPAEQTYLQGTVKGKQPKEIAVDFEVTESTVRNTLSHVYRKLEVEDRAGLAVIMERYEIVE
jgi:DNA-binding CsgD family transcriptional regulator